MRDTLCHCMSPLWYKPTMVLAGNGISRQRFELNTFWSQHVDEWLTFSANRGHDALLSSILREITVIKSRAN
ncbi:TPA: hypothetical protein I7667_00510 [Vibrio vulnificus]|nr:hypothetical protein [Vibrio vulnificus]